MWSVWCSSCVNSSRLHSGVSSRACSDSYWWSPNVRAVMVFSFEKFPSKTLSSISLFSPFPSLPSPCSSAFLSSHSHPLSPTLPHTLYCSPLSYPCSFFFLSRSRSPSPCYSFSWAGRKWLGCFWILWEYRDGAPFPVTLSSSGFRLLQHIAYLFCHIN